MTYHLNLLPWRQKQRRQRLILFTIQCCIALVCFIVGNFVLLVFSESLTQQKILKQTNLQQITSNLQQVNHQVSELRKNYLVQEKMFLLSTKTLNILLDSITTLPLQRGELEELSWDSGLVILKGYVETQTEFEELNQFLTSNILFQEIKLTHFQLELQHISFQFELQLAMG
ncbi:hypothetical protein [Pasteurella canis]|uniref:hypothetical protein n=1 Tax=Pasteurella canis TaxID=753 RepID=UPI0006663FA1|nr:hypothetical protein [Pasteurella canis]MXN88097.1 hypothetical protein [Pasteurella canis]SPY33849.1 protein ComB [Pasteurella canis]